MMLVTQDREKRMLRIAMLVIGGSVILASCNGSAVDPDASQPMVASVSPADGAVGVSRATPIVIDFDHAMMSGMERHISVYEVGRTDGIPGRWTWSNDVRTLTFRPAAVLNVGAHSIRVGRDPATGLTMCDAHAQHHGDGAGHSMHGGAHMGTMGKGSHRMRGLMLNGMLHGTCEGSATFTTD
jgi:hypothetical protein